MPANKNALIRYKTIDNCLRNKYRKWTLDDLVDACSEALYEMEGIRKGVSVRTVQGDIQVMRSDKLGYNAPIEVYEHKYYRYSDEDYSITNMPLSQNDYEVMKEAVDMLRELEDFEHFSEMSDVIGRLQDKLSISSKDRKPIIHFDSVPNLKGLKYLNPLYNFISNKQAVTIKYKSFFSKDYHVFVFYPYLLKEYRNRWFVFGNKKGDNMIFNLALDRIFDLEGSDEPFVENPDFDSEHFFDNIIGVSKSINARPIKIRIWADSEQSNYIKTKPLHISQKIVDRNLKDGSFTFEINVVENFELYGLLLSFGAGVKVLSPRRVVKKMMNELNAAVNQYNNANIEESPKGYNKNNMRTKRRVKL